MFALALLLSVQGVLSVDVCSGQDCDDTEGAQLQLLQKKIGSNFELPKKQGPNLGLEGCPCVGIGNVPGEVHANISGSLVSYPRSFASECQAWDDGRYPGSCDGSERQSWCSSEWCYVDPCDCDLAVAPKRSSYFPDGKYQGNELYYSYATCSGVDTYTDAAQAEADKAAIESVCADEKSEQVHGLKACRCIGITGRGGSTTVNISGVAYDYPADYGTFCSNHDAGKPPDCAGASPPSWCDDPWCYVDPCECDIATLPKYTSYIGGSTVKGHEVYYSYATCGGTDTFTSAEKMTADQEAIPSICGIDAQTWSADRAKYAR